MAIYRRDKTWWIDITTPCGRRIRKSTGIQKRVKAQELHDKLKAEYWRVQKLGERPRHKWRDAVIKWLKETSHKASHNDDKYHLRWLHEHLENYYLDEITKDTIDSITDIRLNGGVSNATVNRTLEVVRAILRRALIEWEWIIKTPRIRMLPEPKRRIRWLTNNEANQVIEELPEHTAEMMRFTLQTGLRENNVTELEWSQLDMDRKIAWIHPDQAKSRKAIPVPLNSEAISILERQTGKHCIRVFTYKGKSIKKANTKAWRNALKRAGIENFRWHDLRHTWASWHVQQGTPLHVLQELGGWECSEMVRRYAHLNADHLAVYAEKLTQHNIPEFIEPNDEPENNE